MEGQTRLRFFLLVAIAMLAGMLLSNWQQQHSKGTQNKSTKEQAINQEIPIAPQAEEKAQAPQSETTIRMPDDVVQVDTDVLTVKIDPVGGDVVFAELKNYPKIAKQEQGFRLMDQTEERFYVAQSGLVAENGPDDKAQGRAKLSFEQSKYELQEGQEKLHVDLLFENAKGIKIIKRFGFARTSYVVNVEYIISNFGTEPFEASLYGRLKRRPESENTGFFGGALRTFVGAAVSTQQERYTKISFSDMDKKSHKDASNGGWVALVEHYFTGAWIPDPQQKHYYQTEKFGEDKYSIRFVSQPVTVLPKETKAVSAQLFAGPEITSMLKNISPGLELTVDYGILWWLCLPLFWLLKAIYEVVGNWGWSIILTTVAIKALFYQLSAASYRSMGNLRKLQPKIEELKKRHADDKQKFGQEVMGLYRKEKVNPLGGCLPILVQIPVFIALYYVLLESVELRQASFALWITDLSAKDPFYILPLLMGGSMLLQQKMNPPPPDPVQAKVFMLMPIIFTVLFLQFPAGLMLYWVVNNLLSMLQQWFITRKIDNSTRRAVAHAK